MVWNLFGYHSVLRGQGDGKKNVNILRQLHSRQPSLGRLEGPATRIPHGIVVPLRDENLAGSV